ncbi:hypothetical protein ACPC54_37835 [Kitasatospora sp. NPDC094028]
MVITSRITGTDSRGYRRTANIVSRGNDQRYVECESCGYQRRVSWSARDDAESHLAGEHGAFGFSQRLAPGPFIVAGIALFVIVVFFLRH